jgi:hypothetical protein
VTTPLPILFALCILGAEAPAATAVGVLGGSLPGEPLGVSPGGETPTAPVLAVNLVVVPAVASVGQPVTVTLAVANYGSVTVSEMTPQLAIGGSGKGEVAAAPEAGVRPTLLPGEEVQTAWGVIPTAPGTLVLTATVAGTWVVGGRTVTGWGVTAAKVKVLIPPRLEAEWNGPPAGWCARRPFAVTLTIGNEGEAAAAGVAPPDLVAAGPCGATVLAAPPADPWGLRGGKAVTFTWTLVGTGGGMLAVTATVTGFDAGSRVPVTATAYADWTLAAPGAVTAALFVPSEVSRGQWCPAVLTISNTGGYAVTDLRPVFSGPADGGTLRRRPPPAPDLALAPGASRHLVWTWSVAGLGDLPFGVRLACATCDGFLGIATEVSATAVAVRPAALEGSLAVSVTQMVSGQKLALALTVTNGGGAAAERVTALVPTPSTSQAKLTNGPVRATLDRLPAGSATRFVWEWAVTGQGPVWFTSRVSGHDANARWGLSTGVLDAPRVRLLSPASLLIERFRLFPAPSVVSGAFVTASLVVTNRGEAPARLTELSIKEKKSEDAVLGPKSIISPGLPADLPGGDSASLVWTYRTGIWGTVSVTAAANAVEPATGRKIALLEAASNRITVTAWMAPKGVD